MQEIILYGSGKRCRKIVDLLQQANICIKYIVDTNPEKWGGQFCGHIVVSPEVIRECNRFPLCLTMADVEAQAAIRKMISDEYGYDLKEEISYFELTVLAYQNMNTVQALITKRRQVKEKSFIFDCYTGLGLGGIEEWTKALCTELINREWKNVHILTNGENSLVPDILQPCVDTVEGQTVFSILTYLINCMPVIVVTSKPGLVLMTACILKRLHPEGVRIISVVHGGHELVYRQYDPYKKDIDVVVGVSVDIKEDLVKRGIERKKVHSITCPVSCEENLQRTYMERDDKPIRIGYAGRIEVEQKRMDLLVKLIEVLEQKKVNYFFNIAGEGMYKKVMEEVVLENHLESRVKFWGIIKHEEIPDFWRCQDICVNIADYEGRSITQLEAMANGAVPVVTETSGTKEDIFDGENGFLIQIGDYKMMVDKIKYLSEHREKVKIMGHLAHDSILPKCKKEEHVMFWENMLRKQEWMLLNGQ